MIFAAAVAWAGLFAVDPGTPASWGAGAATLSLLTIAIGFNFRNQLTQAREIKSLKTDNKTCRWQTGILVEVLNANQIAVPGHFWDPVPEQVMDMNEKPKRRLRFEAEDDGKADPLFISGVLGFLALAACYTAFVYVFVVTPLQDLKTTTRVDDCVSSLTADYYIALSRTLAAPPAPNAKRDAGVKDLVTTAERIRNRDEICADGMPDLFTPTIGP